ncbi:MFS domain-containing protein [Aphelenchoides besseyi]|nr:MFS domain-containing protein [Aphelenchoides besseyi]
MANDHWPSVRLFATALLIGCGGSFHLGYQITLTNPAQQAFLHFLQYSFTSHYGGAISQQTLEAIWSAIIAVLFVGGIVGSLSLRLLADRIGRKNGLLIAFACTIISSGCSIVSSLINSFELYALSRFTIGWSITVSLGISGIYLTECSPKRCRGFVSMTTGIFVQIGLVTGSVLALPSIFGTTKMWWSLYLVELIMVTLVLGFTFFSYETPGYLLQQDREEEALTSIKAFHNCTDAEAETQVRELRKGMDQNLKPMGLIEVMKTSETRRPTIVGAMTAFAMAFSGIAVINAFAVEILRSTGLTIFQASLANVGLSLLTLFGAMFSAVVVDRFGRRPLLQISLMVIIVVNILIFIFMYAYSIYKQMWIGICLIVIISVFMIAFTVGPGPLCYFITSEMIGQHARSAAQGWTSLVQMTCRSIILAIFLPLKNSIGAAFSYLILFVAPMVFCVVFFHFMLPETKNRNLFEVEIEVSRLPTLPFRAKRAYNTTLVFEKNPQTLPQKDVF